MEVGKQPVQPSNSSGFGQSTASSTQAPQEKSFQIAAPSITLPKGGGAIRGIGEKFAANPVTGTGSMTVPIATSPGRSGFGPQLWLSYDSGAGNGPFGFGWSLSLPAITRKSDKGLPKYLDGHEQAADSDVFILSGSEDLVPTLVKNAAGKWEPEVVLDRTVGDQIYSIRRYRPRIEGLFARIERWSNKSDPTDVFWRSISKDNINTWYGRTAESRIADSNPANPGRIFSWLICQSHDDKGNVIVYGYKPEDSVRILEDSNGDPVPKAHERNRTDQTRKAQRYLKSIRYGNRLPYFPALKADAAWPEPPAARLTDDGSNTWMFETVFDYGEHDSVAPIPRDTGIWPARRDPFSSYRAGFEVRTYRLCQRVLMFHHFPGEAGIEANCLVRSTDFTYAFEDDPKIARAPIYSFLTSVTQSGYLRQGGRYLKKSLPPVEFTYSKPEVQDLVEEVDAESLENLPVGLDGTTYQWTDLHGEGIPGILTEQGGAWYYKRNWSPIPEKLSDGSEVLKARFSSLETVVLKPNIALSSGAQFMDLAGDGQLDLAMLDGPMPGIYEHDLDEGWDAFRPFTSRLNRDMRDPNLKFLDLDGDGHADVLITEDDAFVWHPSLAEEGFGPAQRVTQPRDEEKGPRLVFADGEQSIYLADLSGDGLTDLVRIRNGELCYWPNLGYGQFGAKVTMDQSPLFDHPDLFDQKRIRVADINGSGTTDIIYLHRDGIRLYFNQSGNSWSQPHPLKVFPRIDDLVSIVPVDLLGNGTACLVWSSPSPGDARRPMRYVNLMGGQKPHLLVKTINNLGAETRVDYAPSTKFYLQDKRDGKPWITRLPFPVHVVERVTVTDKWRKTEFSSTYSYHHGYFDGIEREFRGFGRVEQRDVESYGKFMQGNAASPYITDDHDLYQPPIKTVTWYHTGAAFDRYRILSAFKDEYYPIPGFTEHQLPEPTLTPTDLSAEEWREAVRACKGMVLRQEVFELDVDALAQGTELPVRLYTTAYHNSNITRLQQQGINRHAVFLVTESEVITYNYELDLLGKETPSPDPRIAHTLNLRFDKYGRAVQSVAVNYPRLVSYADSSDRLTAEQRDLIRNVQSERHISYTETHFTDELPEDSDRHRLPSPCEVLTHELTGADSTTGFSPSSSFYFLLDDLKAFALSETLPDQGPKFVIPLAYHEQPGDRESAHKRLVEWVRMLYFKDDLSSPEPFGTHAWLGLPYETYKLALTRDLLNAVLGVKLTVDVLTSLNTATISGYIPGTALSPLLTDQWWMRSGVTGFANDAANHFYLPEEYTDPFGNKTTLAYDDKYDLFIQSSTDALGNTSGLANVQTNPADPSTKKARFDYRVLAPIEMVDSNGNHTEVYFDILGMVVASAVKGKGSEADDLSAFDDALANPSAATVQAFCTDRVMNEQTARTWLNRATVRFVYHFGEARDAIGTLIGWAARPAGACGIAREQHVRQLAAGTVSPLQVALECSDGSGNVLMKKVQAEPDSTLPIADQKLRWIINGLTVLNNKGKPVKQYEPSFSKQGFGCEPPPAEGVTPIIYYDAAGRVVRTEMPDGTYSRVEFSPWHVKTFDANDMVLDSRWYLGRNPVPHDQPLPRDPMTLEFTVTPDQRAAWLAAQHANTPSQVHLDSLGREVIAIAHNRTNGVDEKYVTFTKLDAEGKPLWICDSRGNLVMQYITPPKSNHTPLYDQPTPDWRPAYDMPSNAIPCYDIAGNSLFQHSMDAGDRWMLMDAAGKPMLAWDLNETPQGNAATRENRFYRTDYDALHRPTAQRLTINTDAPIMVERYEYQDAVLNDVHNLNDQLVRHYDSSGLVETIRRDFKGNVQEMQRTLVKDATASVVDWPGTLAGKLETETYAQITTHDALNRMTRQENWHRLGGAGAVYTPTYNERGALKSETLTLRGTATEAIEEIRYNAKGQKEYLKLGNGTLTQYEYDLETFRLKQICTTRLRSGLTEPAFPDFRSNLADSRVIQQLHYTYDPIGNISDIYDEAYEPVFFRNQRIKPRSRYVYDALYRLSEAEGREGFNPPHAPTHREEGPQEVEQFPLTDQTLRNYRQVYTYDAVGNILHMRHLADQGDWHRRYAYAMDNNRLLRTWEGNDDWSNSFASDKTECHYDTHGSMLNLANVPDEYKLKWDHRDMIREIYLGGGGTAYCQYDAGKQRSRKRVVNQNSLGGYWERIYLGGYERYRRYTGDPNDPVEEIESHHLFEGEQRVLLVDDVITAKSEAQPGPNGLRITEQTLFRYQYSNHLGSSCLELDHEAEIISYEEYHPYGTSAYRTMKRGIEAPTKRYRYTGMERDEESGLSYHTARYYATWLGRWVSADPGGLRGGLNLYLYGSVNPSVMHDRGGMQDDNVTVTENAAYYSRMADWFWKQGWRDEAEEYKEKYRAALLNEALAEKKKITESGDKIIMAATAVTAVGAATLAVLPLVVGGVAEGGLSFSITSFLKPRLLMLALRYGTPQFVRGGGYATSIVQSSVVGGGAVGSTTLTTTAVATGVSAPAATTTVAATIGTAAKVIGFATAGAVALNPDPLGLQQHPTQDATPTFTNSGGTVIVADPQLASVSSEVPGGTQATSPNSGPVLAHRPISPGETFFAYGDASHNVGLGQYIQMTDPANAEDYFLNVQPGVTGPDVWPLGNQNWVIGELKPIGYRQSVLVNQIRNWGADPQQTRLYFYDRAGNFYEGMLNDPVP